MCQGCVYVVSMLCLGCVYVVSMLCLGCVYVVSWLCQDCVWVVSRLRRFGPVKPRFAETFALSIVCVLVLCCFCELTDRQTEDAEATGEQQTDQTAPLLLFSTVRALRRCLPICERFAANHEDGQRSCLWETVMP